MSKPTGKKIETLAGRARLWLHCAGGPATAPDLSRSTDNSRADGRPAFVPLRKKEWRTELKTILLKEGDIVGLGEKAERTVD